ncbi:MAG: nitroreductase [Bacteroidia bacterium]|nr:nitroreductase [Bacteroidia bacterium]
MDISNLIKNRRSTFTSQLTGERIDDDVVWGLLENANWAPTHYRTEPWRFKVYSGGGLKRLLSALASLYKETAGEQFSQAKFDKYSIRHEQVSHAIVIILHKSGKPNLPVVEEVASVASAVQNLWLSVTATEDLGGYWSSGPLVYLPGFADFLELEENQECLGLYYLGKRKPDAVESKAERGSIKEKVTWITE